MTAYAVPVVIVWVSLAFIFILLSTALLFLWLWIRPRFMDKIIFIDSANRFTLLNQKIEGDKFTYKDKLYFVEEDTAILNNKGKKLLVYSENKPSAMSIGYNKNKWFDSESIMKIINNELVKLMIKTKDNIRDTIILLGALGGILAGISATLVLLNSFGVLG